MLRIRNLHSSICYFNKKYMNLQNIRKKAKYAIFWTFFTKKIPGVFAPPNDSQFWTFPCELRNYIDFFLYIPNVVENNKMLSNKNGSDNNGWQHDVLRAAAMSLSILSSRRWQIFHLLSLAIVRWAAAYFEILTAVLGMFKIWWILSTDFLGSRHDRKV